MVCAGNTSWDKPLFNIGQLPTKLYNLHAQIELPDAGSLTLFTAPPLNSPIYHQTAGCVLECPD